MCSIAEPRRATVSCKNLFSSPTNPPSSSRRHISNNSNVKRSNNANQNPSTRSSNHSTKQSARLSNTLANANVFHIPFRFEQTAEIGTKTSTGNSNFLRTPLNPLSPAFFSTRQISLLSEQKQEIMSRYVIYDRLSLSE